MSGRLYSRLPAADVVFAVMARDEGVRAAELFRRLCPVECSRPGTRRCDRAGRLLACLRRDRNSCSARCATHAPVRPCCARCCVPAHPLSTWIQSCRTLICSFSGLLSRLMSSIRPSGVSALCHSTVQGVTSNAASCWRAAAGIPVASSLVRSAGDRSCANDPLVARCPSSRLHARQSHCSLPSRPPRGRHSNDDTRPAVAN